MESYWTVRKQARRELVIRKSRFIAFVSPVSTEQEALQFVEQVKQDHREATHNVPAFIVGIERRTQRCNDDGEPSGTAGVPVLEVLKQNELTNTAVVVTRYFGGIKLGAGGLIRAYSQAAQQGVEAAGKQLMVRHIKLTVRADYNLIGIIEHEVKQFDCITGQHRFTDRAALSYWVPVKQKEGLGKRLVNVTNDRVQLSWGDSKYLPKD